MCDWASVYIRVNNWSIRLDRFSKMVLESLTNGRILQPKALWFNSQRIPSFCKETSSFHKDERIDSQSLKKILLFVLILLCSTLLVSEFYNVINTSIVFFLLNIIFPVVFKNIADTELILNLMKVLNDKVPI